MKQIMCTLGYTILVDDSDYERLSQHRWYAHNTGRRGVPTANQKRPARRTSVEEGRRVIFLVHEVIRAPAGLVVDHIDGNPWNNQRVNLRVCTHTENKRNQRRKHRPGQFKGVYRKNGRFYARICCDCKNYNLGTYNDDEQAALAYDAAALWLHGDFSAPNFPDRNTAARHPREILARARA